ncbi:hypothetical protein [uncultured Streptococcus sp.]|uniref:hypothetical protein n=1 Tax=uncultured Streptococcus sp. TaxID=83427 RepID=UPI0028DC1FD6|nr:hypothetical protein [uncultured Streptococcus sp.]
MLLYYIFNIITVFLALAFVLIHLVAALSAILNGKKSLGTGFILVGAIVGILALLILSEWRLAIYLWLFGSSMISYGAVMNATNNENFNDSHKQICFLIYLIITFLLFISLTFFII